MLTVVVPGAPPPPTRALAADPPSTPLNSSRAPPADDWARPRVGLAARELTVRLLICCWAKEPPVPPVKPKKAVGPRDATLNGCGPVENVFAPLTIVVVRFTPSKVREVGVVGRAGRGEDDRGRGR